MTARQRRFAAKVERVPGRCWLWRGAIGSRGYGLFRVGQLVTTAHRALLLLAGHDPGPRDVCHVCDTPCCVNPLHLWVGTRSENMLDCSSKDRLCGTRPMDWDEWVELHANPRSVL